MDIFKTFSNCLQKKAYNPSDGFNSFMFCRYLGNSPQTIQYGNAINCLYKYLDDASQYEFVKGLRTPSFIRWIKVPKEPDTKELQEISQKYDISLEKAKDYLEILKCKTLTNS